MSLKVTSQCCNLYFKLSEFSKRKRSKINTSIPNYFKEKMQIQPVFKSQQKVPKILKSQTITRQQTTVQTNTSANENSFNASPLHVKNKTKFGGNFKNGTITSNSATDAVRLKRQNRPIFTHEPMADTSLVEFFYRYRYEYRL